MGLCVFSLPISLVIIEIIYTLSYYHHQIGSMTYYPLFRVRSWNNGMRCLSLYILIDLLSIRFTYNTTNNHKECSWLATDSLCGVWGSGWTTCLLYDGPRLDLSFWNNSWCVSSVEWNVFFTYCLYSCLCTSPTFGLLLFTNVCALK